MHGMTVQMTVQTLYIQEWTPERVYYDMQTSLKIGAQFMTTAAEDIVIEERNTMRRNIPHLTAVRAPAVTEKDAFPLPQGAWYNIHCCIILLLKDRLRNFVRTEVEQYLTVLYNKIHKMMAKTFNFQSPLPPIIYEYVTIAPVVRRTFPVVERCTTLRSLETSDVANQHFNS